MFILNFFIKIEMIICKHFFTELMLKERILANNLIYILHSHKLNHVRKYLRAVDKSFQKSQTQ